MEKRSKRNVVLTSAPTVIPATAPWLESVVLAVGFYLLLYATFSPALPNVWINKIHALQAATFLSIAFLIGGLSRFWPATFTPLKPYRQTLGVLGALSAAAHVFMVYIPLGWNPSGWAFVTGTLAFLLFLAMALTSNEAAVKKLGYPLWKRFHTLGYAALFLVAVHVILVETKNGILALSPLELFVWGLVVLALVVRTAAFLAGSPIRRSYAEHFEAGKSNAVSGFGYSRPKRLSVGGRRVGWLFKTWFFVCFFLGVAKLIYHG